MTLAFTQRRGKALNEFSPGAKDLNTHFKPHGSCFCWQGLKNELDEMLLSTSRRRKGSVVWTLLYITYYKVYISDLKKDKTAGTL